MPKTENYIIIEWKWCWKYRKDISGLSLIKKHKFSHFDTLLPFNEIKHKTFETIEEWNFFCWMDEKIKKQNEDLNKIYVCSPYQLFMNSFQYSCPKFHFYIIFLFRLFFLRCSCSYYFVQLNRMCLPTSKKKIISFMDNP